MPFALGPILGLGTSVNMSMSEISSRERCVDLDGYPAFDLSL